MPVAAVRLPHHLRREVMRLADGPLHAAEIWRRVGAAAERSGFARPSYERIRVLVVERRRAATPITESEMCFEVGLRFRRRRVAHRPTDAAADCRS